MGKTFKGEHDLKWWTPKPHKPHHMNKKLLKIFLVRCARKSGRGYGRALTSNFLKVFFVNIPDLGNRPNAAAVTTGNCREMAL